MYSRLWNKRSHLPKHFRADIDHRCDGDDYLNDLYHDYDIKNRVQDLSKLEVNHTL